MVKLDVFKNGTIQDFKALLQMYISDSVTDIRAVQEHLDRHDRQQSKTVREASVKSRIDNRRHVSKCPSCGRMSLKRAKLMVGYSCPCGYSKMDSVDR